LATGLAEKADLQGLTDLDRRKVDREELQAVAAGKADRVELNALAQTKADAVRVDDLDARKTDRTELATGLAEKADLQGLTDLDRRKVDREELQAVAAGKADRVELALLAESKANVTWVNDIEARKTDRAEVETLMAGKADHEELRALAEAKADATWVTDLETRKSDRSEIHALAHGKLDAAEFESGRQQWIRKLQHHTESIVDLERRLTLLIEEARKRMPEPLDQRQLQTFVEQERDAIAALYVAFEDIFRGTREDIKSRQTVYLDYLQKADLKRAKTPIIDLGCGRGEWLELLQENGFLALGVDVNEVMLDRCRQLNLTVVQGDAVEYLTSLKGASVGAISGFHIAEHLPNHKLIRLMDEAFRVLRRGGMLILETPNPANLVVGSCNFYLDPTHIHPIPAPLLRFLAEARGFLGVQIMPLHPMPVTMHLAESQNSLQLNQLLYGPQDYGLICKKV
jgi:SAM-dependent methyltransferase